MSPALCFFASVLRKSPFRVRLPILRPASFARRLPSVHPDDAGIERRRIGNPREIRCEQPSSDTVDPHACHDRERDRDQ